MGNVGIWEILIGIVLPLTIAFTLGFYIGKDKARKEFQKEKP